MFLRRLSTVAAGAAAVIAVSAGASSAHYCYFNDPNSNAEAGRAGSKGFVSFGTIAAGMFGLCPAGVEVLADAGGVTPSTMINAHGLMAGPTGGNNAISHLDIGAIEAALPDAMEACAG